MKRIVSAVLLLFLVTIISACSNEESTSEKGSSDGKVKLTFWHHTYPPAEEFIKEKIQAYEEENSNIEIELVSYPAGQYDSKLATAFAQGNTPDIVNILDYAVPAYQSKLQPVIPSAFGVDTIEEVEALFNPGTLDGVKDGDDIYMIPEELNTMALFLNPDIFEEAGLDASDENIWPKTWDELFALAEELTIYDDKGKIERPGFNWVWGLDPFWYAQQYWPILKQYGGGFVNEDGKTTNIATEENIKAFEDIWASLIENNIGGPSVGESNAANGLQSFSDGKQAMVIAGPWAPSSFSDEVKENYIVAPLPQLNPDNPETMLYTYGLSVTKDSNHAEEAWRFIDYLTADSAGFLESSGYLTGRKGWKESEAGQNLRGVDIWLEGMNNGSYVWRSTNWLQEGTIIKQAIENFGSGSMTVEEALKKAEQQIDSASK